MASDFSYKANECFGLLTEMAAHGRISEYQVSMIAKNMRTSVNTMARKRELIAMPDKSRDISYLVSEDLMVYIAGGISMESLKMILVYFGCKDNTAIRIIKDEIQTRKEFRR